MADLATQSMPELDAQYRVLREEAGLVDRSGRGKLKVTGSEAAEYLQGQLTNDIEKIEPGRGAYAALLDRKGKMRADMRVLNLADGGGSGSDGIWLDTEAATLAPLLSHLAMYKIGRDAEIADVSAEWAILSLAGPASYEVAGIGPLSPEYAQQSLHIEGIECLGAGTDLGLDLICRTGDRDALSAALTGRGAAPASEEAAEILRVESGRPRFGLEMNEATMPAEAGLEERAVDFEKGCYIGQETVARLHYKGKPNRHLRGLELSAPAAHGEALKLGEKQVGEVGTACVSPARGPIALAIVRREAEPGATVAVGDSGSPATVVDLPFA
jgi:folate-binding protein YgfZ